MAELKSVESPSSEKQVDLIQSIFRNNEDLLKAVRNIMLGLNVTETQKQILKSTFSTNKELVDVVRKKIYPIFEEDMLDLPTGLLCDFWLDIDKDILGAPESAIYQRVNSKASTLELLNKAIGLLSNPDGEPISLALKSFEADPFQIGLLTRSLYSRTVIHGLGIIKQIADMDKKSDKEVKEAQIKNSAK